MRNSIFRHKTSGQYCSENGLHKFLDLYFPFQLTDFSVVFVPAVVRRYLSKKHLYQSVGDAKFAYALSVDR